MMLILAKVWQILHLPKTWQLFLMRVFQDQFLVGVTGVIFNDNNEILFFRHTYRTQEWSLPGGYLKAKEHPKEGIEREIEEESGLIVSADHRYNIRTDRDTARLDIVYIGSYMGGDFRPSAEVREAKFFSFNTLPLVRKDQLLLVEKIFEHRNHDGR